MHTILFCKRYVSDDEINTVKTNITLRSIIQKGIRMKGHLYILHNKCFGVQVYKIGRSKCAKKRLKGYVTSYVEDSVMLYVSKELKDCVMAERILKDLLRDCRIRKDREFYRAEYEYIENKVKLTELICESGMRYLRYGEADIDNSVSESDEEDIENNVPTPSSPTVSDKIRYMFEQTTDINDMITAREVIEKVKGLGLDVSDVKIGKEMTKLGYKKRDIRKNKKTVRMYTNIKVANSESDDDL